MADLKELTNSTNKNSRHSAAQLVTVYGDKNIIIFIFVIVILVSDPYEIRHWNYLCVRRARDFFLNRTLESEKTNLRVST